MHQQQWLCFLITAELKNLMNIPKTGLESVEFYFTANNTDNAEKKRAIDICILISTCGKKTYKLMRNLCASQKPGEKTFGELVQLVKNNQYPFRDCAEV